MKETSRLVGILFCQSARTDTRLIKVELIKKWLRTHCYYPVVDKDFPALLSGTAWNHVLHEDPHRIWHATER